jgi:hypothetical protein
MIKIAVLICRLLAPGPCTDDNAIAAIFADRQDDGTPCAALGHLLLKQMRTNLASNDMVLVRCVKDGEPFR